MKNMSTWLLAAFMVMFAGFRVIVTITNQQGSPIAGLEVQNIALEIGLIFLTLFCLLLIIKRKLIGALIYAISYWWYYGVWLFKTFYASLVEEASMPENIPLQILVAIIGVVLPLSVLIDTLADKTRKLHPVDKKTDWFYKNEEFDRKFDERADRNEYKL